MFGFGLASQFPNADHTHAKLLHKALFMALSSTTTGLRFFLLAFTTIETAVFIDASLAGNVDLTSQLGFVTALCDADHNCNIFDYGSFKSKRKTRTVLNA